MGDCINLKTEFEDEIHCSSQSKILKRSHEYAFAGDRNSVTWGAIVMSGQNNGYTENCKGAAAAMLLQHAPPAEVSYVDARDQGTQTPVS